MTSRRRRFGLVAGLVACAVATTIPYAAAPAWAASDDPRTAADTISHELATVDAIVSALYDVLSGGVGEPRDWDRFRALFADGARLIPTGRSAAGVHRITVWDPEEYIRQNAELIEQIGFVEREIGRRMEAWGNIVQVFSAYEAFRDGSAEAFLRGINSIQLWNDGTRWWIVSIMWEAESAENPLPAEFR